MAFEEYPPTLAVFRKRQRTCRIQDDWELQNQSARLLGSLHCRPLCSTRAWRETLCWLWAILQTAFESSNILLGSIIDAAPRRFCVCRKPAALLGCFVLHVWFECASSRHRDALLVELVARTFFYAFPAIQLAALHDTGPMNSRFCPCLACCQPTGPYAAKPRSQPSHAVRIITKRRIGIHPLT